MNNDLLAIAIASSTYIKNHVSGVAGEGRWVGILQDIVLDILDQTLPAFPNRDFPKI